MTSVRPERVRKLSNEAIQAFDLFVHELRALDTFERDSEAWTEAAAGLFERVYMSGKMASASAIANLQAECDRERALRMQSTRQAMQSKQTADVLKAENKRLRTSLGKAGR